MRGSMREALTGVQWRAWHVWPVLCLGITVEVGGCFGLLRLPSGMRVRTANVSAVHSWRNRGLLWI